MTPAFAALLALKAHLATITTANGYAVTVASVRTGQAALAVGNQEPLPVITLTMMQDDVPREAENPGQSGSLIEAGPGSATQFWERTVWLEGFVSLVGPTPDAPVPWDQALDTFADAIRRALVRYSSPLRMTGTTFTPPEPGGTTAVLKMQLVFPYSLNYPIH